MVKHLRDYGKIDPMANPITMVYELVEYLNLIYTLGKKEESELVFFPKKCDYEVYKVFRIKTFMKKLCRATVFE